MSSYIFSREQCSKHTIFPGVDIHTLAGQGLMLSLFTFEPFAVVQPHAHPHEQMGLLLDGELQFDIGGETARVQPGQMWRIPGGVRHGCTAGAQGARALDIFHPIREDYL